MSVLSVMRKNVDQHLFNVLERTEDVQVLSVTLIVLKHKFGTGQSADLDEYLFSLSLTSSSPSLAYYVAICAMMSYVATSITTTYQMPFDGSIHFMMCVPSYLEKPQWQFCMSRIRIGGRILEYIDSCEIVPFLWL